VETPDVIDLRKAQRKEPEKQLYQVLEEKEERAQQGTILGTSHTYVFKFLMKSFYCASISCCPF
jgi:splicing factor 3B subunit 2